MTAARLLCFLAFFFIYSQQSVAADDARPNVIVILVDDMGYSDLGCFGSEIKTPNLDKLATNGIRYTQMYNTAKCWTTRISLLTGLYHIQTGRDFNNTAMIGEVIQPTGYHTWWSGKHHASFNPHERGFDHFSGFLGGAINFWNPGDKARPGEPMPGWRATYTWAFDNKLVKPFIPDKSFYATDTFTDWALQWLDESKDDGKPFFLYMAYNAPHWPLHAHERHIAKYKGVYDEGYESIRNARYKRQVDSGLFDKHTAPLSAPEYRSAWNSLSDEEKHNESMRMSIHAAMIDCVDQNVGRLINKLRDQKKLGNTLILFLVDNGASPESPNRKGAPAKPWGSVGTFESIGRSWATVANTPLRKWKTSSHEGGACTPMIAHWPKGITVAGRTCREPVHLIDIMPTMVEFSGVTYPAKRNDESIPPMRGVSLTPTLKNKPLNRGKPLFWQYAKGSALRDGKWKLVRSGKDWELYDMSNDRTETSDLAASNPERVKRMGAAWDTWYRGCTGNDFKLPVKRKKTKKPGKKGATGK